MRTAIRRTAPITEDGRIEILDPELRVGMTVDVIVIVHPSEASKLKLTDEWLAALDELQRMAALSPEAAAKWIEEIRAERDAYHPFDDRERPA